MPGSGGTGERGGSLELGTAKRVEERNPRPQSQPTVCITIPIEWGRLPHTCSKSSTVYREGKAGGGGGLARPLSWHAPGMLFTERPVL